MEDLKFQVQRLIDAGVPEQEIGAYIQKHSEPQKETPQKSSIDPLKDIEPLPEANVEPISIPEKYGRPALEYGGLTVGGIAGTSGGPAGQVAGAGLGYGIGKKTADIAYGKKPGTIGQEVIGSAKDVGKGMAMEMGGQIFGKLAIDYGKPTAVALTRAVRRGVEKAIRPSVALQKTAGQAKQYYDRATQAVGSIIANKNSLKLTDESGKAISGLPKTLKQFSESIQQTKQLVFKEYDALSRQAGEAGIKINLEPIGNDIAVVAENKVLRDMAPDAASYATDRAKMLLKRGVYSPSEAQEAVQILNSSLSAFYKNPTYETASKAYIDSMIANNLRKSLDSSIEGLTGAQYQQLKNSYGALSHIESDVARRTAVDARKNIKGLIDFSDIFSGSEVVRGILSRDPSMVGMGATAKGIASYYRYLNNPNRIVKNMFGEAEKIITRNTIKSERAGRKLVGRTGSYFIGKDDKLYYKK